MSAPATAAATDLMPDLAAFLGRHGRLPRLGDTSQV